MQAPFSQKDLEYVLESAQAGQPAMYVCGINLAWLDFVWTATPGSLVRWGAVKELVKTGFVKPTRLEAGHV